MYVVYMQGASRYVHVEDIQDASRHVYVTIHAQSVSLYVCIYIYIYTYIYIYICMYVHMYVCMHVYIYIYMYGWMCAVWGWVGGLWTKLHDEPALRNLISPEPPFAFDDLFGGPLPISEARCRGPYSATLCTLTNITYVKEYWHWILLFEQRNPTTPVQNLQPSKPHQLPVKTLQRGIIKHTPRWHGGIKTTEATAKPSHRGFSMCAAYSPLGCKR